MTILVIEDSAFTRRQLTKTLTAAGCEVWEAVNGKEGLERIKAQTPDCIFLDLLMPELDGIAVLQKLKQDGSSIPVVVLSADIQETTRTKCLELGAVAFLEKPPHNEQLLEIVHGLGVC
jgi:CheY-like chemotaxis protein